MKDKQSMKIDDKMLLVNQKIEEFLLTDDSFMNEIMKWQLRSKGKQLRPRLMLMSASFGSWKDRLIEFAAALEILHMASLVHDDIVDDAQQRRGKDSVQYRFGRNAAVYAGDYMVFCVLSKFSYLPSRQQCEVYRSLSNLCKGELMQYENLYNVHLTEEKYIQQIQGKTATLFQIACSIGSIESGCKDSVVESLAEFGKNFGIMFQLQDDLLDCVGAKNMGKRTESDIGLGVYTLPLVHALNDPIARPQLKVLLEEYRNKQQDDVYHKIQNWVIKAGGVEYTIERLKNFREWAIRAIEPLPNIEEKTMLINLSDAICNNAVYIAEQSVAI